MKTNHHIYAIKYFPFTACKFFRKRSEITYPLKGKGATNFISLYTRALSKTCYGGVEKYFLRYAISECPLTRVWKKNKKFETKFF